MLRRFVLSCLVVAALRGECLDAAKAVRERFEGKAELHPGVKPCRVGGDFDGDGKPDAAYLVRLLKPAGVVNPWSRERGRIPGPGDLAIAVVFGGAPARTALIGDREMFRTPIWESPDGLLTAAHKMGKVTAIGVATESGADVLVYWTGAVWRLKWSEEAQ